MFLKDYLTLNRTFVINECQDKHDLIEKAVGLIEGLIPKTDHAFVVKNLLEKEGVFSTGVGNGIAIPHAVIPALDKTYLSVFQLKKSIDYKAVDNKPVSIIFMLLSPEGMTREHIKLLARIARICFKADFVRQMNAAAGSRELYKIIVNEDEKFTD